MSFSNICSQCTAQSCAFQTLWSRRRHICMLRSSNCSSIGARWGRALVCCVRGLGNRTTPWSESSCMVTDWVSKWTSSRSARRGRNGRKRTWRTLVTSGSPMECILAWATSQMCLLLPKSRSFWIQVGIRTPKPYLKGMTASWRRR